MAEPRRKFDADFREGAVRLVRETGKPIAQVARDLGINEGTLDNWVNADKRRRGDGSGVPKLEAQTGRPVRSEYRSPGEPKSPRADAIIVAPATYNTINKWANGISDTYALGILAEAPGLGITVVALPFINSALAGRAAFKDSVNALRSEGVRILLGPGEFEPHPPGSGGNRISYFPWHLAIESVSGGSEHV
jgi:transposase-like protein